MRGLLSHARRDRALEPDERRRQAGGLDPDRAARCGGTHNDAGIAMKHITFYLDFISPYAYLAFEQLPEALLGLSYSVTYKPLLFAGLLKHHGQLGPAEIAPKRDWTYRQVLWLAQRHGRGASRAGGAPPPRRSRPRSRRR